MVITLALNISGGFRLIIDQQRPAENVCTCACKTQHPVPDMVMYPGTVALLNKHANGWTNNIFLSISMDTNSMVTISVDRKNSITDLISCCLSGK